MGRTSPGVIFSQCYEVLISGGDASVHLLAALPKSVVVVVVVQVGCTTGVRHRAGTDIAPVDSLETGRLRQAEKYEDDG